MRESKSILIYETYSENLNSGYGNPLINLLIEKYPQIPQMNLDSKSDIQLQHLSEKFIEASKELLLIFYFASNTAMDGLSNLLLASKEMKNVKVIANRRVGLVEKVFEVESILIAEDWEKMIGFTENWINE